MPLYVIYSLKNYTFRSYKSNILLTCFKLLVLQIRPKLQISYKSVTVPHPQFQREKKEKKTIYRICI